MPISRATIQTTPYYINQAATPTLNVNGNHRVHDPNARWDEVHTPQNANLVGVTFTRNDATGTTYYLPFSHNNIHSLHLPANPGFAATLVTANLDGCWMFVEHKADGSVVVYHANAFGPGMAPTAQQSATDPQFQTAAAQNHLDQSFTAAAAHYNGVATVRTHRLRKPRYVQNVHNRLVHKAAQGRIGVTYPLPEHASFSTFIGAYHNGHWEFWFQTYSQFYYRRPKLHVKSALLHRTVNPHVTTDPFEIMEATRWVVL